MKRSLNAILRDLKQREEERERGTWKQALRERYAPWFDELVYGFEFNDGWWAILDEAMAEIARICGGPQECPDLRITRLRRDSGRLVVQSRGLWGERRDAVDAVIRAASDRSLRTCEQCGRPGSVRESAAGILHAACDGHAPTD